MLKVLAMEVLSIDRSVWFHCLEGQPESIVADIDNMVKSYVEKVSHSFSLQEIEFI